MALSIWVATLLVYVAFRLWYDGLRKPLTAEEVEECTRLFEQRAGAGASDEVDLAVMRKFLEEGDGREFILRLHR